MIRRLALALPLVLAAPAVAGDKPVARVISDLPAVTLDPAKAYVLLRAPAQLPLPLLLVRAPSDTEWVDWRTRRAEAFTRAQRRYAQQKARYDQNIGRYANAAPDMRRSLGIDKVPEAPVEESFGFPPPDFDNTVPIGPQNRFSKVGESVYLMEVPIGTYTIYGVMMPPEAGVMLGTCFCMGTLHFTAPAGAITDLGAIAALPGTDDDPVITSGFVLSPATAASTVDPRLASVPRRPADYHATGRLPNVRGVMIDRLRPIEGLLRYERDHVIDGSSGAEAPRWVPPTASR